MVKEHKPPLHLPAHPPEDRAARERAAFQRAREQPQVGGRGNRERGEQDTSSGEAAASGATGIGVTQMLSFLSVTSAANVLLGEIPPEDVATPSLNGASSEEGRAPAQFYASSRGGGFRIAIGEVEYRLLQEQGAVILPG